MVENSDRQDLTWIIGKQFGKIFVRWQIEVWGCLKYVLEILGIVCTITIIVLDSGIFLNVELLVYSFWL